VAPTPAITCKESRIGKAPISIPKGVTVKLTDRSLEAKGPLGLLTREYPREVKLQMEGDVVTVLRTVDTRRSKEMHGLFRTLTANMINGVSTGFKKDLELIGVGYRASVQGQTLTMNLGYSHPVVMTIPEGITVKVESNTRMNISGRDKELVGQFAASIRKWRPPEPYKGKGIKFQGEVIRRKAGKAGKKK
jgi:large subunit ribosomal protein L6